MKIGRTLEALAHELDRRAATRVDYLAPVTKLKAIADYNLGDPNVKPGFALQVSNTAVLPLNNNAHGQLAEYLKIPKAYYDRMLVEAPQLLADSTNRWLQDKMNAGKNHGADRRMVRTLFGEIRALLSDSYRRIENEEVFHVVYPILRELGVIVMSAEITDNRFYIKAVDERITLDVPTGAKMGDGGHTIFDTISPAIIIRNSETGAGRFVIEHGIFTRACTNLAAFGASLKKTHTGSRAELSEEAYELLSDQTKAATDAVLMMQIADMTRNAFARAQFEATAKLLADASQDRIEDDVVEVVTKAQKKFAWNEAEKSAVLTNLIKGGDLSRYGLHSAITRSAQDVKDYDRASELEVQGGQVITLDRSEWKVLAKAA